MNTSIYQNIATRTAATSISVVGRCGRANPPLSSGSWRHRSFPILTTCTAGSGPEIELPQSGSGRTVTAEPKFVPEEAAQIQLEGGAAFSVRLIDCVGYMVRGALGQTEDDQPRMVTTPWYDHPIPMTEAAEIGTRKVIAEHSTIGIVITTDGSISDIPREDYLDRRAGDPGIAGAGKAVYRPAEQRGPQIGPDSGLGRGHRQPVSGGVCR